MQDLTISTIAKVVDSIPKAKVTAVLVSSGTRQYLREAISKDDDGSTTLFGIRIIPHPLVPDFDKHGQRLILKLDHVMEMALAGNDDAIQEVLARCAV